LENNLAETAFFVKNDKGYLLRWFTPELEIDLCGHATLASAHILFTELGYDQDTIYFDTVKAGTLAVKRDGDKYSMDFPSRPPFAADKPEGLIEALGGKKPKEILRSRDYFLVYDTEDDILDMKPDHFALAKIDTLGVIVTRPVKMLILYPASSPLRPACQRTRLPVRHIATSYLTGRVNWAKTPCMPTR
jgi:predicted PhzF superfamily epimerase YddE/YHI9